MKIGEACGLEFHCAGDNWLAHDIKVHANVVIGGRIPFAVGQAQDREFVNNTFVDPVQFASRILADDAAFPCSGILVRNNIFHLTESIYFNVSPEVGYNSHYDTHLYENDLFLRSTDPLWTGPDPYSAPYDAEEIAGTVFTGNLSGDPLFVDLPAADVQLQPGSPAIGSGASAGEPLLDLYLMPYGTPRAIGAVEFSGSVHIPEYDAARLHIFPVPATDEVFVVPYVSGASTVIVRDARGAIIHTRSTSQGAISISTGAWAQGVYFVEVFCAGQRFWGRVVK